MSSLSENILKSYTEFTKKNLPPICAKVFIGAVVLSTAGVIIGSGAAAGALVGVGAAVGCIWTVTAIVICKFTKIAGEKLNLHKVIAALACLTISFFSGTGILMTFSSLNFAAATWAGTKILLLTLGLASGGIVVSISVLVTVALAVTAIAEKLATPPSDKLRFGVDAS